MATTQIFRIDSTDGINTLIIQPRTVDGTGGFSRNTDLTLYGYSTQNWGEAFNENFYRLIENFAVSQKAAHMPKDEADLGAGLGINIPLQGQLWYNKDDNHLYVQTIPTANIINSGSAHWDRLLKVGNDNIIHNVGNPSDPTDAVNLQTMDAAIASPSDIKLKENISVIKNVTDKVAQLNGVEFYWKRNGKKSAGVIAQDVEKILPQAVTELKDLDSDDTFKTVNYDAITALLVEVVKNQEKRIQMLELQIMEMHK